MRNISQSTREKLASISRPEAPILLLEITHVDLTTPVRVINDNADIISNGDTYVALAFRATLPDDLSQGAPRANISIDNVGRDLTQWIESSGGADGSTVRMMQVMRSAPDVIEWEVTMDLTDISMNASEVRGALHFKNLNNTPGIALFYRPENTPGLF